jgi:CheY-like chemotaxis protein
MNYVLIVDDDEDDRDLFCDALNLVDPTITCFIARDGEEALAGLRNHKFAKPDIIFLDLNMPRLNGIQCLGALKKEQVLQDIPVIIFTTSKLKEDRDKTQRGGASDFITKPTTQKELCSIINRILLKHGMALQKK